jgi:hypothetical protein
VKTKVGHVLRARLTGNHRCHWPGCELQVPPAMWGCRRHWYKLPHDIRQQIWATYRTGQEIDRKVSAAYIDAARAAQEWISEQS